MRRLLLFLCLVCASAVYARAQSGIEVPTIGAIVDSSGALRPVQGVAGSFLLGPADVAGSSLRGVLRAVVSGQDRFEDRLADGETDAPPGPAIFGLDGDRAMVFFPEPRDVRALARRHAWNPLDWVVDGEVLSVRLAVAKPRSRCGGTDRSGSFIPMVPWSIRSRDATGPVLLLPDGVLFATADRTDPPSSEMEARCGSNWRARKASPRWALTTPRFARVTTRSTRSAPSPDARVSFCSREMRREEDDSTRAPAAAGGAGADRVCTRSTMAWKRPSALCSTWAKSPRGTRSASASGCRNVGGKTANITDFFADGAGFSVDRPTLPFSGRSRKRAGRATELQPTTLAPLYPGNLQLNSDMNSISVTVIAAVVVGPVLTVFPVCTGSNGSPPSIDFGLRAGGPICVCATSPCRIRAPRI